MIKRIWFASVIDSLNLIGTKSFDVNSNSDWLCITNFNILQKSFAMATSNSECHMILATLFLVIKMVIMIVVIDGSKTFRCVLRLAVLFWLILLERNETLNTGKESHRNEGGYFRCSIFLIWEKGFSIERSKVIPVSFEILKNCLVN